MSPKKRKPAESPFPPAPKKRITRSSAGSGTLIAQVPAESSKVEPQDSKTATSTTHTDQKLKKAKTLPATSKQLAPAGSSEKPKNELTPKDPPPLSTTVKSLSIFSDLVKQPIQCAYYKSSDPSTSALIFTHGAGGTISAPAVVNFCSGFSTSIPVLVFQGSMNLTSRVKAFHACIDHNRSEMQDEDKEKRRLILGGRSMGARAAVKAATQAMEKEEWEDVRLILASYPLVGPKDTRDQILLSLPSSVSVLFIIGDRDAMCPLDLLNDVRGRMEAKSQLVVMKGADHGMHTKPAGVEKERGEETGRVAAEWIHGGVDGEVVYVGEEE